MDIATLQRFAGYDIGSIDVNHLVLKDPSVCARHVRIEMVAVNSFCLFHLPSGREDSVQVNGKWIHVGEKVELRNHDHFTVGGVKFTFETNVNI